MPFSRWHRFTIDEIEESPDCKGVYQLCDAKGEIVYIGSSESSIYSRLAEHKGKTKFMKVKNFQTMRVGDDIWGTTAKHVERRLCERFRREYERLPRLQGRSPRRIDLEDWLDFP